MDEGNIAAVVIGLAKDWRRTGSTSQFRGADVFGKKIEWHVQSGKPKSAVLRVWKTGDLDSGASRNLQHLEVYAINPTKTCLYAVVDAIAAGANAKAEPLPRRRRNGLAQRNGNAVRSIAECGRRQTEPNQRPDSTSSQSGHIGSGQRIGCRLLTNSLPRQLSHLRLRVTSYSWLMFPGG
jgi:hypothetical protein